MKAPVWAHLCPTMGLGGKGNRAEYCETHHATSTKVLCLLPISVQLWRATMLATRENFRELMVLDMKLSNFCSTLEEKNLN